MRPFRHLPVGAMLLGGVALLAFPALTNSVHAQNGWSWETEEPRRQQPWEPPRKYEEGPVFRPAVGVERSELAPVMAGDGSGLPYELWTGLDIGTLERLLANVEVPSRSPTLHDLWRRLMTADLHAGVGAASPEDSLRFEALRLDALFRSALLDDLAKHLSTRPEEAGSPVIALHRSRSALADGRDDEACSHTQKFLQNLSRMPRDLAHEAVLISGYCVARKGNASAAGIAAGFAREQGIEKTAGLAALDAIAHGTKPEPADGKPVLLIEYKLLVKAGFTATERIIPEASASLLVVLAREPGTVAGARLAAGEAAARLNALDSTTLAELYRTSGIMSVARPADLNSGFSNSQTSPASPQFRAALFLRAETEQAPIQKARAIRRYLDEARGAGLYLPALRTMSAAVRALRPAPELHWFAETAIEVLLAANEPRAARAWLALGDSRNSGSFAELEHWRTLIDIFDTGNALNDSSLLPLEHLALRGGFAPDQLHRIATVLDALDYQIPIPLWEEASRTPQPSSGHLPETGVLSRLQEAAAAKEFGRTVLLAMSALGPEGPEGAHIIALGDAIRALRKAGLEAEARRLGFEALFPAWPRRVSG